MSGDSTLPPMPPAGPEDEHAGGQTPAAGDGLGDSTAPAPKTPARGKQQKEPETA